MKKKTSYNHSLPHYQGQEWVEATLPRKCELWAPGNPRSMSQDRSQHHSLSRDLETLITRDSWRWPSRATYFFSDLHADTDAFFASLVASGGIKKTGPGDSDFKLTKAGRKAHFLIGGDCFDKGPSSLRLLRAIRALMDQGAELRILAGNHDIRILLGISAVELASDPRTEHFFIRLGPKVVPLLREIRDHYLTGTTALQDIPPTRECRRRLYPSRRWFKEFPQLASWVMPDAGIEREMKRLEAKMEGFEENCQRAGLNLREVYAATRQWRRLFLKPKGEFSWFYRKMRLAHKDGSFLFIHAGLDDRIARILSERGLKHLNRKFRKQVEGDPFEFYYGPLANTIRTKYREVDMPLTRRGINAVHNVGIHAIVHGHRNLLHGQRIMLRQGMINFECDTTLDRNTRSKEGLNGLGASVTIFHPSGLAMGISADYPFIKLFQPEAVLQQLHSSAKGAKTG